MRELVFERLQFLRKPDFFVQIQKERLLVMSKFLSLRSYKYNFTNLPLKP